MPALWERPLKKRPHVSQGDAYIANLTIVRLGTCRRPPSKRRHLALFSRDHIGTARHGGNLLAPTLRRQIAKMLETAIARLPATFRPVFVLREIEGLSVEDTAEALQIPEETVKTRLFRARRRLQKELDPELCGALSETFPFAGADCEGLTNRVITRFRGSAESI